MNTAVKKIFRQKSILFGTILFSFFMIMLLVSFVWIPYGYDIIFDGKSLVAPSAEFFLGTDDLGRDLFSRLLKGSQFSLGIGLVVGGISIFFGASLGLSAAYFGRRIDFFFTQIMNALQAMPSLLLALFVVAILGPSITNTIISVALVSIPSMYRLVRSQALVEMSKEYIQSAKALGASDKRIIFRHLLPNCATAVLVQSAVCCSEAILNTAALGFLGLGIPAPYPEWGTMLADSRNLMESAPQLMWIPGLCLLLLILSTQLLSDGFRDQLKRK